MAFARNILQWLFELGKKVIRIFFEEILGNNENSSASTENSQKPNLVKNKNTTQLGLTNQIGDRIVNQGTYISGNIHFDRPLVSLAENVDPRDLDEYLTQLEDVRGLEARRTRVEAWYANKTINSNFRDMLLVVLNKLDAYVSLPIATIDADLLPESTRQVVQDLSHTAQNLRLDEIDQVRNDGLAGAKSPKEQAEIYFETAKLYLTTLRYDKAKNNLEIAYGLDPENFHIVLHLAILYNEYDELESAEKILVTFLPLIKVDDGSAWLSIEDKLQIYNELGQIYLKQNVLEKATDYLVEAINLYNQTVFTNDNRPVELIAKICCVVGSICIKFNQLDKAQEYLVKAAQTFYPEFDATKAVYYPNQVIARIYNNLAAVYALLGMYEKALEFDIQALHILQDFNQNNILQPRQLAMNLVNLACLSVYTNDLSQATLYNDEARITLQDSYGQLNPLFARTDSMRGNIFLAGYQDTIAFEYFEKALDTLRKVNQDRPNRQNELLIVCVYCDIGNILSNQNKITEAKEYYLKAKGITDNLFGFQNTYSKQIILKLENPRSESHVLIVF